jgi:hypothetical protein
LRHRRLLLAALVVNLGVALGAAGIWFRDRDRSGDGDVLAFRTGWTLVWRGEGASLYDFAAQTRVQHEVTGGHLPPTGLLPFLNPPHVALALAPLAPLSLRQVLMLWRIGLALLLVVVLRTVARERPALEAWLAGAALAAAPPTILTFELGAFSLLVLLALLRARDALAEGRDRTAGLWLAVGAVKPQLVVMPLVALLMGRRWRALGAAGAALAVAVLASTVVLGWRVWPDWMRALRVVHEGYERLGIRPEGMSNLKGVLALALGPSVRAALPAVALAGWLLAMLLTAWIWRGVWPAGKPRLDLQLAATLLAGSFFSLHLYGQDGLVIAGAALLFDNYLRRSGRPRTLFATVALAAPIVWLVLEVAMPPTFLRVGVVLQVALAVLMVREVLLTRRRL